MKHSQKSSIFGAVKKRKYGNKRFLFGLLQTGITWHPDPDELKRTPVQSLRHQIAERFVVWLQRLLEAIEKHAIDQDTIRATQRSAKSINDHQQDARALRSTARKDYNHALGLNARAMAATGKGKSKGKVLPLSYNDMSQGQRWYIDNLENLRQEFEKARTADGGAVAAKPFRM